MAQEKKVSNTQKEQTVKVLRLVYDQAHETLYQKAQTIAEEQLKELQKSSKAYAAFIKADKAYSDARLAQDNASKAREDARIALSLSIGEDFNLDRFRYNDGTTPPSVEKDVQKGLQSRMLGILRKALLGLKRETEINIMMVDTDSSLNELLKKFKEAVENLGK